MILWQAINYETEEVIYQADSAGELAAMLRISVYGVYTALYRDRSKCVKMPGRNRKFRVVKVVIDDD